VSFFLPWHFRIASFRYADSSFVMSPRATLYFHRLFFKTMPLFFAWGGLSPPYLDSFLGASRSQTLCRRSLFSLRTSFLSVAGFILQVRPPNAIGFCPLISGLPAIKSLKVRFISPNDRPPFHPFALLIPFAVPVGHGNAPFDAPNR